MSWTGNPRRDVAEVMRLMYQRGLVQVRGGNVSIAERNQGIVYMSPTGVPRNLIRPEDTAIVTLDGRVLEGKPTSEWRMHLAVYHAASEAKAAVHAHPKSLLALTHLGLQLDPSLMSEAGIQARCIARVPWITPGTQQLADAVKRTIEAEGCNVIILERHGALVWSDKTIYHALDLLEAIEDLAWIQLTLQANPKTARQDV